MKVSDEEFKVLRDAANNIYNRGYKACNVNATKFAQKRYEKGLEDIWNCARKIHNMNYQELNEVFPESPHDKIFNNYSAREAMQKVKEYEELQKQTEKHCDDCKYRNHIMACSERACFAHDKWESNQKQDEKCEKCTKGISAECVVDGCEFEAEQSEKNCKNCGQPRDYKNRCIPFSEGKCIEAPTMWISKQTDATDSGDGGVNN